MKRVRRQRVDKMDNFPDGYVEERCKHHDRYDHDYRHNYHHHNSDTDHYERRNERRKPKTAFSPSSVVSQTNLPSVIKDGGRVLFNVGMVDGDGIEIRGNGSQVTFNESGTFRFEFTGRLVPYSDAVTKVIFRSDKFQDEIKYFTETELGPKNDNGEIIFVVVTMIPMARGESVSVHIVNDNVPIILQAGARLQIYRVS